MKAFDLNRLARKEAQRIVRGLLAAGFSRRDIANAIGGSAEAVRLWRDGRCAPAPDALERLRLFAGRAGIDRPTASVTEGGAP